MVKSQKNMGATNNHDDSWVFLDFLENKILSASLMIKTTNGISLVVESL
jgi:hypothetical protein